jgi:hypothetical protein
LFDSQNTEHNDTFIWKDCSNTALGNMVKMLIALEHSSTQRGGDHCDATNSWAKAVPSPLDNIWGRDWMQTAKLHVLRETEQLVKDSYEESSNLYRGAIQTWKCFWADSSRAVVLHTERRGTWAASADVSAKCLDGALGLLPASNM